MAAPRPTGGACMNSLIEHLTGLAAPWLYVAVGTLAAAEAAILVGLVFPGETALLIGGFAASQGRVNLAVMVAVAVGAAIVGDSIGYEVGRHFGPRIRDTRVGRWVGQDRWERAERSLQHRGGPAVMFGRWVGILRAIVPGVAGMTRMPYRRFLIWNVIGALVWAPTMVIGGYLAGSSYRALESWLGRAGLVIFVVLLVGVAGWRWLRWAAARQEPRGDGHSSAEPQVERSHSTGTTSQHRQEPG